MFLILSVCLIPVSNLLYQFQLIHHQEHLHQLLGMLMMLPRWHFQSEQHLHLCMELPEMEEEEIIEKEICLWFKVNHLTKSLVICFHTIALLKLKVWLCWLLLSLLLLHKLSVKKKHMYLIWPMTKKSILTQRLNFIESFKFQMVKNWLNYFCIFLLVSIVFCYL